MFLLSNITNQLLTTYAFYASLLSLYTIFISFLTGQARLRTKLYRRPRCCSCPSRSSDPSRFCCWDDYRKSFANPEDAERHGGLEFARLNEDVERLRRLARNDMESIPSFLLISMLYMFTGPLPDNYKWCFRAYTFLRFVYALAYRFAWPAPIRSVTYSLATYCVCLPMLVILFLQLF